MKNRACTAPTMLFLFVSLASAAYFSCAGTGNASPRPPEIASAPAPVVSFYRLRIEYSTSSDWTTLDFCNATNILAMRLISVSGNPTRSEAGAQRLALNQPLDATVTGQRVSMTADVAVSPAALHQPFAFLLKKGATNDSVVRVFHVAEKGASLLREIRHELVETNTLFNALPFSVDLDGLKTVPPLQARIERPSVPKTLFAFYYPWYHSDEWSSARLRDRPIAPYSSDDRNVMKRHIEQARAVGIDCFVSSWWGPGSYTDQNLKPLLDLAHESRLSVSIYFETLKNDGPRDKDEIFKWLSYAISTYRDHPAFLKVNGKPLIVVWASQPVPLSTWKDIFAELRAQKLDAVFLAMGYNASSLDVFDGVHDYGVFTIPDLAGTFGSMARTTRCYALLADPAGQAGKVSPKMWTATVQPGYDERSIPNRRGLYKDRDNGAFYRHTFETAIESDPDWIFITTWNEWWENTHIEPSQSHGDLYLKITREFAAKWKGK